MAAIPTGEFCIPSKILINMLRTITKIKNFNLLLLGRNVELWHSECFYVSFSHSKHCTLLNKTATDYLVKILMNMLRTIMKTKNFNNKYCYC